MKFLGDLNKKLTMRFEKAGESFKLYAIAGFLVTLIIFIVVIFILYGGESILPGKDEMIYTVTWQEQYPPAIQHSHELTQRQPLLIEDNILQENLTFIQFELTWEDNREGILRNLSDKLTLNINPPPGTQVKFQPTDTLEGYDSPLRITALLNNIPSDITLPDFGMDEVSQKIKDYTASNGKGVWEINLSIDARSLFDRGNEILLVVTYGYYEALIGEES
jgi:hypothetical protein